MASRLNCAAGEEEGRKKMKMMTRREGRRRSGWNPKPRIVNSYDIVLSNVK